jgi:hypothetical protein
MEVDHIGDRTPLAGRRSAPLVASDPPLGAGRPALV